MPCQNCGSVSIPYSSGHFDQRPVQAAADAGGALGFQSLFIGALRSTAASSVQSQISGTFQSPIHRGTSINQQLLELTRASTGFQSPIHRGTSINASLRVISVMLISFNPLFIGALRST